MNWPLDHGSSSSSLVREEDQAWRVRAGVEYTAGAALWGREEEDGRRREGGEEESGLSPDLSSNLETKEGGR